MPKKIQSLLYICLVLSGCVKHSMKFPCGISILQYKTLTQYIHHTISTWEQYEKTISSWIHRIRTIRIHYPRRLNFLILHYSQTLEDSTCPTKRSYSSKTYTQFYYLPSEILLNIGIWYAGIVHRNKLKLVLVLITQHHPVLCAHKSYKLKYVPFEYLLNYNVIKYAWEVRHLRPHKYNHNCKWGKDQMIKHELI